MSAYIFRTLQSGLRLSVHSIGLGIRLALLLALVFAPLQTQQLLTETTDSSPKHHARLTSSTSEGEDFYVAGISSSACYMTHFVARLDADGKEVWNSLNGSLFLGAAPNSMSVIDEALYVTSIFQRSQSASANTWTYSISKFDKTTGEFLWTRFLEDVIEQTNDPTETPLKSPRYLDLITALGPKHILIHIDPFGSKSDDNRKLGILKRDDGEVRRLYKPGDYDHMTSALTVNDNGDIITLAGGELVKLHVEYGVRSDKLEKSWGSFNITPGSIEEIISGEDNRLFVLTKQGRIVEVSQDSGRPFNYNAEPVGNILDDTQRILADKIEVWPYLYCAWYEWERLDNQNQYSFSLSKHNLDRRKLEWHRRTAWPKANAYSSSLGIDQNGDPLLVGMFEFCVADIEQNFYEYMTQSISQLDGSVNAEKRYTYRGTTRQDYLLPGIHAHSNSKGVHLFGDLPGNHESARMPHMWRIADSGLNMQLLTTLPGKLVFDAAVVQNITTADGILELCFSDAGSVVRRRNSNYDIVWSTTLPHNRLWNAPYAMQVNDRGEIAVVSSASNYVESSNIQLWADIYNVPDFMPERAPANYFRNQFRFYVLDASGQLLLNDSLPEVGRRTPSQNLYSQGNKFYMSGMQAYEQEGDWYAEDAYLQFSVDEGVKQITLGERPSHYNGPGKLYPWNGELYGIIDTSATALEQVLVRFDPDANTFSIARALGPQNLTIRKTRQVDEFLLLAGEYEGELADSTFTANIRMLNLNDLSEEWSHDLPDLDYLQHIFSGFGDYFFSLASGRVETATDTTTGYYVSMWDWYNGELLWQTFHPGTSGLRQFPDVTIDAHSGNILVHPGLHIFFRSSDPHHIDEFNLEGEHLNQLTISSVLCNPARFGSLGDNATLFYSGALRDSACYFHGETYDLSGIVSSAADSQLAPLKQLNISPNPAETTCRLDFPGLTGELYNITVYDLRGNKVLNHSSRLLNTETGLTLDVADLSSGAYYISVSGAGSAGAEEFSGSLLIPAR